MTLFFVLAIASAWCLGFAAVGILNRTIHQIIERHRDNHTIQRRLRGLRRP